MASRAFTLSLSGTSRSVLQTSAAASSMAVAGSSLRPCTAWSCKKASPALPKAAAYLQHQVIWFPDPKDQLRAAPSYHVPTDVSGLDYWEMSCTLTVLARQMCKKPARRTNRTQCQRVKRKVNQHPVHSSKPSVQSLLEGSPRSSSPHRGSRCIGMRHKRQVV